MLVLVTLHYNCIFFPGYNYIVICFLQINFNVTNLRWIWRFNAVQQAHNQRAFQHQIVNPALVTDGQSWWRCNCATLSKYKLHLHFSHTYTYTYTYTWTWTSAPPILSSCSCTWIGMEEVQQNSMQTDELQSLSSLPQ